MDNTQTTAESLLRRALESFDWMDVDNSVAGDIRAFLAAEPEAEPVAYINLDEKRLEWAVPFEFKSSCFVLGKLPLYLHPPKPAEPAARKPMTEEEIDEEIATNEHYCERSFAEGVRWAEKHHGIGLNKSDQDSIDLQSRCRGDKL